MNTDKKKENKYIEEKKTGTGKERNTERKTEK